jgi:hypothetical protein
MNLYIEYINEDGKSVHTDTFRASELVDQMRKLNKYDRLSVKKEPPPACRHDWIKVDHSFDHKYGTQVDIHEECSVCGETRTIDSVEEKYPFPLEKGE